MFFNGWDGILRIALVGSLGYAGLILLIRIAGKRSLAKLNAFDLVVTVALGSTLASILLDRSVPLVDGLFALALLLALQFLVAWLSVRSERVDAAVKAEPTLLLRDGRMLRDAMRGQRVTEGEVLSALRSAGLAAPARAAAVVLETDGTLSVVAEPAGRDGAALAVLPGMPGHRG
jgi:uncharacterized membrane protein YcaP (DUF421 family)